MSQCKVFIRRFLTLKGKEWKGEKEIKVRRVQMGCTILIAPDIVQVLCPIFKRFSLFFYKKKKSHFFFFWNV